MRHIYFITLLFVLGCAKNSKPNNATNSELVPKSFEIPYFGAWKGEGNLIVNSNAQCAVKVIIERVDIQSNQLKIKDSYIECANNQAYHLADRTLHVSGNETFEGNLKVGEAYLPYQNPLGPFPDSGYRSFSYKVEIPELGDGPYFVNLGVYPKNTFKDDPMAALFFDISLHTDKGNFVGFTSLLRPQGLSL